MDTTKARYFTKEEEEFLKQNMHTMSVKDLAKTLGRHVNSIYSKLQAMGKKVSDQPKTIKNGIVEEQDIFIILREDVSIIGFPEDVHSCWRKIYIPERLELMPHLREEIADKKEIITEQQAKALIRKHNMSLVHKHAKGEIYEMPGNPFFQMHQNFYAKAEEAKKQALIESMERARIRKEKAKAEGVEVKKVGRKKKEAKKEYDKMEQ